MEKRVELGSMTNLDEFVDSALLMILERIQAAVDLRDDV